MNIKHRVIKEFQYLSSDKKIFTLKPGTILENYKYKLKNDVIDIDKEVVESNPDYFVAIDWKQELILYLKNNKIPNPTQTAKKLIPFIEEMILSMSINNNKN